MSTPSFSRPGAVDLSALKRPAAPAGGQSARPAAGASGAGAPAGPGGSYTVELNEQNFQAELQGVGNVPVVLVFYSARMPASVTLAGDLDTLADELEGRFLLGRVDVDAAPGIAQALQIPSVPLVALAMGGQLAPLLQDAPPLAELRNLMTQVLQAAAAQGLTGRAQPRGGGAPEATEEGEPPVDPRYAPAQDALAAGDVDLAVAEYQKLVDANPADAEAAGGLAMAKVLQRTAHLDASSAQAARTAGAERPDDVDAQTLVADLDLLGGHVDDAFSRLVDLVRRTSGEDREKARTHLVALFAAVGNDDPRVLKARQALASALF
jgi:putative thioredoxin